MKRRQLSVRLIPMCLAALISGCAAGPNFKSPPAAATSQYGALPLPDKTVASDTAGGAAQAFLAGREVPADWWALYGSEKLNTLVQEALTGSPSVASAQAALRQAQANLRARRASVFPSFDGGLSARRQKFSSSQFGGSGFSDNIFNLYNASVTVAYGIDLAGGTRRGIEAQAAAAAAERYVLEATYQTLIANVVTASVREAELRALISAQEYIVEHQDRLLTMTGLKFKIGAVGRADLLLAQSNLATERALLPPLRLRLTQAQNQLAVYVGKLPSEHTVSDFNLDELQLPQEIPVALPSTLVRRRPDVLAAEARLHQATANVGVATANLFPQITITGAFGTQATAVDQLFKGDIWNVGANLTQPLFHAGELTAKRRAAVAALAQSAADYRLTVLQAFQNVADVLRTLETDAQTLQARYAADAAAEASLRLSEKQYALGSIASLNLLIAQQQYTRARVGYVQARAARLADTAALFQALGGGWTERNPQAASAP